MAVIERVFLKYQNKDRGWITGVRGFNLSKPVGRGQPNEFGDVYLVQALFDWILREGGVFKGGALHSGIVPAAVTGSFNEETDRMIILYQQGGEFKVERTIRPDGIIAGYEYDHVRAMLDKYPLLKHFVIDKTDRGKSQEVIARWKNTL